MDYLSTAQASYTSPASSKRADQERTHVPRKDALAKKHQEIAEEELRERLAKQAEDDYYGDSQWRSEFQTNFTHDGIATPATSIDSNRDLSTPVTVYTQQAQLNSRAAQDIIEYLRAQLLNEIDPAKHGPAVDATLRTPDEVKSFLKPYSLHSRLTQLQFHSVASYLASLGIAGGDVLKILAQQTSEEPSSTATATYAVTYTDENERQHKTVVDLHHDGHFPKDPVLPQDLVRTYLGLHCIYRDHYHFCPAYHTLRALTERR